MALAALAQSRVTLEREKKICISLSSDVVGLSSGGRGILWFYMYAYLITVGDHIVGLSSDCRRMSFGDRGFWGSVFGSLFVRL